MALEQLGSGNAGVATTDGNVIPGNLKVGASTSLLGFYGATQVAKQTVNLSTTTTATTTALEASINVILVALKNLGLITSTAA